MQALPKTIYLWLVILVLSFMVKDQKAPRSPRGGVGYETYLAAERQTRLAFAKPPSARRKPLDEALLSYRQVALTTDQPNPSRKVLIVSNQLGKPLDKTILKRLPEKEWPLWQALYGKSTPAVSLPSDAEVQLKAMRLKFLDNQALADLYHKQGMLAQARAAEARRDEKAQASDRKLNRLVTVGVALGMLGFWLFLFVLNELRLRRWKLLGRVPERVEKKLGWGDLLDVFVFYLAFYRGLGALSGPALLWLHLKPDPILFSLGLRILSDVVPLAYLWWRMRPRQASWSELGMTRERLGGDVLYGVAGYAVLLPIGLVLRLLSERFLERYLESTANAVLPMIATRTSFFEQSLLFATTSLAAPFFEELFFRGALFTGLRRRFSGVPTILISALLFAVVHPQRDWLPIFGMGVCLATMRHLRQSVVPGMVTHALQNGGTFLMMNALFGE